MSRTPAAQMAVPIDLPPEPPELNLSDDPSVKGKDGAVHWYRQHRYPVTMNAVVQATNHRRLPSYLIGGAVWYSTRDLWQWVMRQRRSTARRSAVDR